MSSDCPGNDIGTLSSGMLFVLPGKGCTCLDTPRELPYGGHIRYPAVVDEKNRIRSFTGRAFEHQLPETCSSVHCKPPQPPVDAIVLFE